MNDFKPRFDGLFMYLAVAEMQAALAGARLRKIQQLSSDLFLFTAWKGVELRFIVCLTAGSARMHLVEGEYGHAETPSSFCMLLRKHLEGGRLESVRTVGLERVAVLEVGANKLVCELLPNSRNLILLAADDTVLGDKTHRHRHGQAWEMPIAPRPHAIDMSGDQLLAALSAGPSDQQAIVRICFGIGKRYVEEILKEQRPLGEAWDAFWGRIRQGPLQPCWKEALYPWPFHDVTDAVPYPSVSALLEAAFQSGQQEASLQQEREVLLKALERQAARVSRKLVSQQEDLEAAKRADDYRKWGDLVLANLRQIPARAKNVVLPSFEDGSPLQIPLNEELSAQDNAQHFYQQYKKAKRGQESTAAAMEQTRLEAGYLDSLVVAVQTATTRDELREIEAEMREGKIVRTAATPRKRPRTAASRPRRYQAHGWNILVGRNPAQNEQLSLRQASPTDLWLHARAVPGAHVLLRGAGEPPPAVLLAAAQLAAVFSQGFRDTRVAVDYTRIRFVKKPPGTPPGYVTYSKERTLIVEPNLQSALKNVEELK